MRWHAGPLTDRRSATRRIALHAVAASRTPGRQSSAIRFAPQTAPAAGPRSVGVASSCHRRTEAVAPKLREACALLEHRGCHIQPKRRAPAAKKAAFAWQDTEESC